MGRTTEMPDGTGGQPAVDAEPDCPDFGPADLQAALAAWQAEEVTKQ